MVAWWFMIKLIQGQFVTGLFTTILMSWEEITQTYIKHKSSNISPLHIFGPEKHFIDAFVQSGLQLQWNTIHG